MTSPAIDEERAEALGALYEQWLATHPGSADEADDDPAFVDAARLVMGLPPLGGYDAINALGGASP